MLCETMFCVLKLQTWQVSNFYGSSLSTFSDDESPVRNLMMCLCMSQLVR